ncbi:hypothetical protein [Streptomyces goshikiensis]|uniref:hypothetical protein n=1 Tax=Streptomyces goshikiensis TaxID=1942 RepID=UPI0033A79976
MCGAALTGWGSFGALLARLEVRERQFAVEAEAAHEQNAQLTALLDGLTQAAEHIAITRKTLLEPSDEVPPAPAAPAPALPDGPAYQQIMAVFAAADAPLRARNVCEAMDLDLAPNNINNVRIKLKRLTGRGIHAETEPGLHQATTVTARQAHDRPTHSNRSDETDIRHVPPLRARASVRSSSTCLLSSSRRGVATRLYAEPGDLSDLVDVAERVAAVDGRSTSSSGPSSPNSGTAAGGTDTAATRCLGLRPGHRSGSRFARSGTACFGCQVAAERAGRNSSSTWVSSGRPFRGARRVS